jgi:hypothetical protein
VSPGYAVSQTNLASWWGSSITNSPTQRKVVFWPGAGQSEYPHDLQRDYSGIRRTDVVSSRAGVVLSVVAVYLTEQYLGPIDQAEANYSAAGSH